MYGPRKRKHYLWLPVLILALSSCRSVKKTVDKVSTETKKDVRTSLSDDLTTSNTVTLEEFIRSRELTVDAKEGDSVITIEEQNGKLIIRGAKKVSLASQESDKKTVSENVTKRSTQIEHSDKTTERTRIVSKETKKKGVPTGFFIAFGLLGLACVLLFVRNKKGNLATSLLDIFKPNRNDKN